MFKNYRTYMAVGAIVATVVAENIVGVDVLTPEVTAAVVTLLGALAAYFRSRA